MVLLEYYNVLVIKAEQLSSDDMYKDFVFPDKNDNLSTYTGGIARLMITNDILQNIGKCIYAS